MKKLFTKNLKALVLVIFLLPGVSKAQPFVDLLNLKAQMSPGRPYVTETSNKLSVNQYEGTFVLPMVQKNKDVILFGGDYTNLNFNTSGKVSTNSNLYSTSLLVGYEKHWNDDKCKLLVLGLPKYNSDDVSFNGKDFQMGGIVMFKYQQNENLKYHFGAYYNREFFGNYIMPLLGIEWKISDKLNLFGDLPVNMTLEYKLGKSLYVGGAYASSIGSYRLNGTGGTYVRDGDKLFGDNQLKLFVNAYITKNIVAYAEGGQTLGREFQLYDSNNNALDANPIYQRSLDGLFFNVGLAFRFRTDVK